MATSEVQIVNNALVKIGANAIISLTENSEAARAANVIFEQVRDASIRDHIWNFSERRVCKILRPPETCSVQIT